MTMVLMTVLIDDPAEYQIMICLMTVLFRMDDPQHVATAPLATVFTEAFRFGSMLPLDHNTRWPLITKLNGTCRRGLANNKMLQTMMQMSLANWTSLRTATCLLYHSSQIASSQSLLQHHSLTQFSASEGYCKANLYLSVHSR
jgi:hypothetical protein